MKSIFLTIMLLASFQVMAVNEVSLVSEVSRIISYNNWGDGDVGVELAVSTDKTCEGYWLNKDDKGFTANLSLLMAAYHAKSKLQLYGETETKWGATGSHYCHLELIDYK